MCKTGLRMLVTKLVEGCVRAGVVEELEGRRQN